MTKKKQRGVKRSTRRFDDALGALGTKSTPYPNGAARSHSKSGHARHSRSGSSGNHQNSRRDNHQNPHPDHNRDQNNITSPQQHSSPSHGSEPRPVLSRPKVPEALPLKSEKMPAISRLTARVFKKPAIQEVVREPTAGGIVFRMSKDKKDIEILLIQDSKGRWTIPKGHIEPGENAKQTAVREIGEESGLYHIEVLMWLGKIHFQYRRIDKLVLMTTQIYLVRALDDHETPTKEQWMKGIKWFRFNDALDAIEYEDIEKLMLLAKNKIRQGL